MRAMGGVVKVLVGAVALAWIEPVFAQRLEPISYEMLNGNDINANYLDRSYDGAGNPVQPSSKLAGGIGDLADGIIATGSWFAAEQYAPHNGPYVGWDNYRTLGQPTITFRFGGLVRIDAVTLYADDAETGGVSPPRSMRIAAGGATRDFPVVNLPGTAPASWRFAGLSLTGSDVVVTLNHSWQWIMVSEIAFEGVRLDATGSVTRLQVPVVPSPYRTTPFRIPSSMLPACLSDSNGLQHIRVLAPDGRALKWWIDSRTAPFVFDERFDDGLRDWAGDVGSFVPKEGFLESHALGAVLAPTPHLNNYSVEVRLKLPQSNGQASATAGVAFGYQGWSGLYCGQTGSSAYAVTIDRDGCELLQLDALRPMKSLTRWPLSLAEGAWHDLRVLHQAGGIAIHVDGTQVGAWSQPWADGWTWRDTSYIGASEAAGLIHLSGSGVQWDDFAVKNLSPGLRGSVRIPPSCEAITSVYVEVDCSITSGASDISTTFDLGDDFDDATFDTATWGILPMYQYPAATYSNALPWLDEKAGAQEFLCVPSAPAANVQVYTKRSFRGRVRAQCRFSKGGYVYRNMMLADAPRDDDRIFTVGLMFNDWGGLDVNIWSNKVLLESQALDSGFFFRNYFGEVDLQIERNTNGTFTFNAALEGPNAPTWTYTSRSRMPTSAPLHAVFFQSLWDGAPYWGGWRRYQDDVRVVDDEEPDRTAPVTAVTFSPTPGSGGLCASAVSAALVACDDASGVKHIAWSLTGGGSGIATGSACVVRIDREGKTKLSFNAVDFAGNVETTQCASVLVDLSPPLVKWSVRSYARKGSNVTASAQFEACDAVSGLKSKSVALRTRDVATYTKCKLVKKQGATSILIDERDRSISIHAPDPEAVLVQLRAGSLALPASLPVRINTSQNRRWVITIDPQGTTIVAPCIVLTGRAVDYAGHAAEALWP